MMKTWTISDLLKETRNYLYNKGIENPRLDSELLLSHCLKKDRVKLYMDFESPVTPEELISFRECVKRRAKREPVSYILGFKEFWSIKIMVTKDVLIPRPETEVLIEHAAGIINDTSSEIKQYNVLEMGTGSGAIPVVLANENNRIRVFSVDISLNALKAARMNINLNKLEDRIRLFCGDGLEPLKLDAKFDMIISNPPYVCSGEIDILEPEVRDFEPRMALDGGKDGLGFFRKWVPKVPDFLKAQGWVLFEMGAGQAKEVKQIFVSSGSYEKIDIIKDYEKRDRVVLAQKK